VLTGFDENKVLIGFDENQKNRSVFGIKFKFQIWGGGAKTSDFSNLLFGFLVYRPIFILNSNFE
jgi:hypothetical protein